MQDLVRNATKYEEIENIKISDHSAHEIYRNTNWWPNLYLKNATGTTTWRPNLQLVLSDIHADIQSWDIRSWC